MQTLTFNGEPADTQTILAMPELQGINIISIRFSRWIDYDGEPPDVVKVDRGGRIDVDVDDTPAPVLYVSDLFVSSPKINDDPEKALDEAIAEMEKGEGADKSIALITLSMTKYLKSKKNKLK